jgi:hypothetical protein
MSILDESDVFLHTIPIDILHKGPLSGSESKKYKFVENDRTVRRESV